MKLFFIPLSMAIILWSCDSQDNFVDSYFEVNSQPAGARVFVNGIDAGVVTPATIRWNHWTTEDDLVIGLSLEEYYSWDTSVVNSSIEYIWHQMIPDYPVGEWGDADLRDTIWFTDPTFDHCSEPLIGTRVVQGRASNVIGDSVAVVLLGQENPDSMWRIVPQAKGKLWVPLYGYGFWQAEVDRDWWRGSVMAMLIYPDKVIMDTTSRYQWWQIDVPATAVCMLGGDEVFPVLGWKINWGYYYFSNEPHLRIQGEQLLMSNGAHLYSVSMAQPPCPYPYRAGKYSLTVASQLDELPDNAKFVFAIRPIGEWLDDDWVGFEFLQQENFDGSFMNGLLGENIERRPFTFPSSWDGSMTYQIELMSNAIGQAKLRYGLGENPSVWQDSTSFIIPIFDQANIVMQFGIDDPVGPSPNTTVTLDDFTYTP